MSNEQEIIKPTEIFNWSLFPEIKEPGNTGLIYVRGEKTMAYYVNIHNAVKHKKCKVMRIETKGSQSGHWFCKLKPDKIKALSPKQLNKLSKLLGQDKIRSTENIWIKINGLNQDINRDIKGYYDNDYPIYNFSAAIYQSDIDSIATLAKL
jgi:hypothetical protein